MHVDRRREFTCKLVLKNESYGAVDSQLDMSHLVCDARVTCNAIARDCNTYIHGELACRSEPILSQESVL